MEDKLFEPEEKQIWIGIALAAGCAFIFGFDVYGMWTAVNKLLGA